MQLTYTLPADSLNEAFLQTLKNNFAGKDVSITVQAVEPSEAKDQMEAFHKMEKLRHKLKRIKIDPDLDLSALANEVNL